MLLERMWDRFNDGDNIRINLQKGYFRNKKVKKFLSFWYLIFYQSITASDFIASKLNKTAFS